MSRLSDHELAERAETLAGLLQRVDDENDRWTAERRHHNDIINGLAVQITKIRREIDTGESEPEQLKIEAELDHDPNENDDHGDYPDPPWNDDDEPDPAEEKMQAAEQPDEPALTVEAAKQMGTDAYFGGLQLHDSPLDLKTEEGMAWRQGWLAAEAEEEGDTDE